MEPALSGGLLRWPGQLVAAGRNVAPVAHEVIDRLSTGGTIAQGKLAVGDLAAATIPKG